MSLVNFLILTNIQFFEMILLEIVKDILLATIHLIMSRVGLGFIDVNFCARKYPIVTPTFVKIILINQPKSTEH